MYNYTNGDPKWKERLEGFLGTTQRVFFPEEYGSKIMVEYACETQDNCNKDQRSFKAYLSRWLAVTMQLAPFTTGTIMPWIQTSAQAASKACTRSAAGLQCGRVWYENKDDGLRDVGNQMTALSIVQSNLVMQSRGLADIKTGDSKSDPGAGHGGIGEPLDRIYTRKITTVDRAGAWLITSLALLVGVVGAFALLFEDTDLKDYTGFLGGANIRRLSWRS
jgi:mannan endo-1,6-alpha-mannosidase